MADIPSKETILGAVVSTYYDDLDFIEALNNMTYARKVQLKANLPNQQTNGKNKND